MSEISPRIIRARRAMIGETQAQFGERFGVTRQAIASWENDDIGPPAEGPTRLLLERVFAEFEAFDQEPVK